MKRHSTLCQEAAIELKWYAKQVVGLAFGASLVENFEVSVADLLCQAGRPQRFTQ